MLRWLKTVVVSDEEKAPGKASGGDREGERKRIVADVLKPLGDIKPGRGRGPGISLAGVRLLARRCPAYIDDASLICGIHGEQDKVHPGWCAGGPARSYGEGPVMGLERRGRVVRGCVRSINPVFREESCGRAESTRQVVLDFEVGSLGGVGKSRRTRVRQEWTGSRSRSSRRI
jgi:hypothetical protein